MTEARRKLAAHEGRQAVKQGSGRRPYKMPDLPDEEWRTLLQGNTRELAERFGVNPSTITWWRRKYGIKKTRGTGSGFKRPRRLAFEADLLAFLAEPRTFAALRAHYGQRTRQSLHLILKGLIDEGRVARCAPETYIVTERA